MWHPWGIPGGRLGAMGPPQTMGKGGCDVGSEIPSAAAMITDDLIAVASVARSSA